MHCLSSSTSCSLGRSKHLQRLQKKKQYRNYQQGLGGAASIVNITGENNGDPLVTMTNAKEIAKEEIRARLSEYNGIKWYFTLIVAMFKFNRVREEITISVSFRGETETLLGECDIDKQYNNKIDLICDA